MISVIPILKSIWLFGVSCFTVSYFPHITKSFYCVLASCLTASLCTTASNLRIETQQVWVVKEEVYHGEEKAHVRIQIITVGGHVLDPINNFIQN